ncbi:PrpF domain-containing protein [Streptomyces sp. NPDC093085]|uniref:2-methylaconitate cis-trans isomerase PrpF family protein n=1 Tax=Streptomyces sp. NPDC093085 TaxID=3155068 RepID=UPI0034146C11
MAQRWIPTVFTRGGTSKGLFFHGRDLPAAGPDRDAVFVSAMGSPDPYGRQLNGMGGGQSSLSKVMIIEPSSREDAEVEYTFGQVDVKSALVDYAANCGNLSSAVGPFAVDEGLCPREDGTTTVRIHNTNTGKLIHATFEVRDGVAETDGSMALPGVAGTGAPVELEYFEPAGTRTGALLPTGLPAQDLTTPSGTFRVSMVDATNPMVFVRAADFGLDGTESPDSIEARLDVMARLDCVRRAAATAMGMCDDPSRAPLGAPKIAVVAAPAPYTLLDGREVTAAEADIAIRVVSMGQLHRALPGTAALCSAVAARVPGTLLHDIAPAGHGAPIHLASPSGVLTAGSKVEPVEGGGVHAVSASLFRTARPLMKGFVAV